MERALLREGNVSSADDWRSVLEPIVARYRDLDIRRLALPPGVKHWSLTTLREKLIKIGAKVVSHARCVIFQMAEMAVPRK